MTAGALVCKTGRIVINWPQISVRLHVILYQAMKSHFVDNSLAGVYEAVGGAAAFRRVSIRFHHKVEQDAELSRFFPKNMAALEERLALYLTERTGGPSEYTASRGK